MAVVHRVFAGPQRKCGEQQADDERRQQPVDQQGEHAVDEDVIAAEQRR